MQDFEDRNDRTTEGADEGARLENEENAQPSESSAAFSAPAQEPETQTANAPQPDFGQPQYTPE